MAWYIIAGIAFAVALGLLIFTYVRDRRYEKMRVLNAMSAKLRNEIEEERAAALIRRDKFRESFQEAIEREGKK
jgi:uncharacterized membrane protein